MIERMPDMIQMLIVSVKKLSPHLCLPIIRIQQHVISEANQGQKEQVGHLRRRLFRSPMSNQETQGLSDQQENQEDQAGEQAVHCTQNPGQKLNYFVCAWRITSCKMIMKRQQELLKKHQHRVYLEIPSI